MLQREARSTLLPCFANIIACPFQRACRSDSLHTDCSPPCAQSRCAALASSGTFRAPGTLSSAQPLTAGTLSSAQLLTAGTSSGRRQTSDSHPTHTFSAKRSVPSMTTHRIPVDPHHPPPPRYLHELQTLRGCYFLVLPCRSCLFITQRRCSSPFQPLRHLAGAVPLLDPFPPRFSAVVLFPPPF